MGVLALAVEDTVQTRGEQAAGIMDLTQEGVRRRLYPGKRLKTVESFLFSSIFS